MSAYRYWRRRVVDRVIDQLRRGDSLPQIDRELSRVRSLSEDERAALWLLAWGEQHRGRPDSDPSGREPQDPATAVRPRRSGANEAAIRGARGARTGSDGD